MVCGWWWYGFLCADCTEYPVLGGARRRGGDLSIKALVGMYILVSNIWLVGGDSFQREICFTNRMLPFV